jgi:hypothetical protein
MTTWQRLGYKPATTPGEGLRLVRAKWRKSRDSDYVSDALALLAGWTRDGTEICRTLDLDDAQHAQLTERVKVAADALQLCPEIRRVNGCTQIRVGAPDGGEPSLGEITLAARIEDAYRAITHDTTGTP